MHSRQARALDRFLRRQRRRLLCHSSSSSSAAFVAFGSTVHPIFAPLRLPMSRTQRLTLTNQLLLSLAVWHSLRTRITPAVAFGQRVSTVMAAFSAASTPKTRLSAEQQRQRVLADVTLWRDRLSSASSSSSKQHLVFGRRILTPLAPARGWSAQTRAKLTSQRNLDRVRWSLRQCLLRSVRERVPLAFGARVWSTASTGPLARWAALPPTSFTTQAEPSNSMSSEQQRTRAREDLIRWHARLHADSTVQLAFGTRTSSSPLSASASSSTSTSGPTSTQNKNVNDDDGSAVDSVARRKAQSLQRHVQRMRRATAASTATKMMTKQC